MNGFEALAGAISDLADSAEDAVAGGAPPAAVIQESVERTRAVAYAATMAARGRIAPDDLGAMLGRDGNDTLMLRPGQSGPEPQPPGRHRGRGAVRCVRQWLARAWARAWLSS